MNNKPIRFLHLAYHIHTQLFVDGMMISGFYNWHQVFEKLQNPDPIKNPLYYGKFGYWHQEQNNLNDYDIIFVGISRPETEGGIVSMIRKQLGPNSKTIIVGCVDYAVEMWGMAFNLNVLALEVDKCDYIFAAERSMVSHLKALLPHRTIHFFSHPTDTRTLKKMALPIDKRENSALAVVHRYDNNWQDMNLAYNLVKGVNKYTVLLDGSQEIHCLPFFDNVMQGMPYPQFMQKMSRVRVVIDSYHRMHSYGRIPVECACLKVPVVSTDWVTSARLLFPETTIEAGDVYSQGLMAQRLIDNPDFYSKVVETAYEKVEECGYEAAFRNMMNMIYPQSYKNENHPAFRK